MSVFTPAELEREVLELWDREGTFAESLKRREGSPRYSFYDGPPYATGSPHYGHILQTAVKDAVTRYWTMRGYRVDRRVGWDCHGLPIENMVESEFNEGTEIVIRTKRDIEEKLGIEKFNAACREAVLRRVKDFTDLLQRLGRWADYDKAYKTMETPFMESAWWVFKTAWERGLVYRGLRSSPYCPRCETALSNFEATQGYQEDADPAITVKCALDDEENTFLLVWTTTPWTLPANVAVAVNPDLPYVRVRVDGASRERWILAKERLSDMVRQPHEIEEEFLGRELVGKTYKPLFSFLTPSTPAFRVVEADFVSAQEGTGLVHVAPAFGEEDLQLAQQQGLPLLRTVDASGKFIAEISPWKGRVVTEKGVNEDIIEDLDARGLLVSRETIRHQYPHCWRCSTSLIYMAVDSWFIAVTKIKDQLLKNAEQIHWVPTHLKEGRFGQGLRDAPDWAISRTRYWGIPLPVWQCAACEEYTVVGSVRELEQQGGDLAALKSPHANPDLHRPYVDRIVLECAHCKKKEAHRVPEVLDVWFDSGSMPYGQWHYPFENKELVESTFPADFIGEALDQTRGWFYTLHVLAGILTLPSEGAGVHPSTSLGVNLPAFKNVVASGLVLAEDGRKLSKRFGNYPEPDGIVSKYGADTLRLYLLSSARTGEDYRFSDQLVGDLYRRFTLILWNVWQFFRTYGSEENSKLKTQNSKLGLLDRWIFARTAQLAADVQNAMDAYRLDDASRALIPFVDDLSTWYVRRSRGRAEALPVLREVLRQFSLIAAPFIPFLSEHIHRELTVSSPHLADFPIFQVGKDEPTWKVGDEVLEHMRVIRDVAHSGHLARAVAKIRIRQPLAEIVLKGTFEAVESASEEGNKLLRDELNVKKITLIGPGESFDPPRNWVTVGTWGGQQLHLDTQLTDELKQEGLIRDLIRRVQDIRKQAQYHVDDIITLLVVTDDPSVRNAVERFREILKEETKSREVRRERVSADAEATFNVGNAEVWLGVAR